MPTNIPSLSVVRGQASLEYLLVLAALFAFLAVWVPVITNVQDKALAYSEASGANGALSRLAFTAEEVYLLGDGNMREVCVGALNGMTLRISNGKIAASYKEMDFEVSGKFNARNAEITLPESDACVAVYCCVNGKAEFTASRGLH